MAHCCVFFYTDSTVISIPKSKLTLRGTFDVGEEVEAKFKDVVQADTQSQCKKKSGNASWTNYLGKIVKIDGSKEQMKAFENFYKIKLGESLEKGCKPSFEYAKELLQDETWYNKEEDGKRKRKTTQKMAENLSQSSVNGTDKENTAPKNPKQKKTNDEKENANKKSSSKNSSVKKREDAQKGAIQSVSAHLLPTLPGSFAAQFGYLSSPLSKSFSTETISGTSTLQTMSMPISNLCNPTFTSLTAISTTTATPITAATPITTATLIATTTRMPDPKPMSNQAPMTNLTTMATPISTMTPTQTQTPMVNLKSIANPRRVVHPLPIANPTPVSNQTAVKNVSLMSIANPPTMENAALMETPTQTHAPMSTPTPMAHARPMHSPTPRPMSISTPASATSHSPGVSTSTASPVMTPLQSTQRPGSFHLPRHPLRLLPGENIPIHLDFSSDSASTPPQQPNSWTNLVMSPDYPDPNQILDELRTNGTDANRSAYSYQDLQKTVYELKKENNKLKNQVSSLQEQLKEKESAKENNSGQLKGFPRIRYLSEYRKLLKPFNVPGSVYSWMKNIVENCGVGQGDGNSLTYTVSANLNPSENGSASTLLLEDKPESAVDRADLRKTLSLAGRHGPLKLLHGVIRLMFSEEELAQSCAKGLRRNKSGREPLDPHKISICEDFISIWCEKMIGMNQMKKKKSLFYQ